MVGKWSGVKLRKWWVCNFAYGFCESPPWPMDPGQPCTPAGWNAGFPGQLLSSYIVFVPLILEQIKQSSLINGFPPCLSEQIIKHSLHLSLLPSHTSCFPVRDICSVRLLLPALPTNCPTPPPPTASISQGQSEQVNGYQSSLGNMAIRMHIGFV